MHGGTPAAVMHRAAPAAAIHAAATPAAAPAPQGLPDVCRCVGCMQGASGDGSTPSLLDARAASPSAVYNSLFTTTPFRGALAALPIDAAVNAPLVDSSPFDLTVGGTIAWQP
jgi:hypothetical protein